MTEMTHNRGHDAPTPMHLGWRGTWDAGKRIAARIGEDRIGLVAAVVAFFSLLALFPGITALVAIAGILLEPGTVTEQLETATTAVPDAVQTIILSQVEAVAGAESNGLSVAALTGLALALYSASRGVSNLIAGLNVTYAEDEDRGFVKMIFVTLALTAFLIVVLALALAIVAVIPTALSLLGERPALQTLAQILRWPLLLLIGAGAFTVLYRYGPSRRAARWRWLAPGGVVACVMWLAASIGFSWYVETLGTYTETFGALGGVIVLLLWLWISAFAVLLGALIDAELEAQTRRDSTIGEERPMGARGAVKADTWAGDT